MGNEDIIKWEEKYLIGDDTVDSQHQRIFELANEMLVSFLNGDNDTVRIREMLNFLMNYVVFHFSDEEGLQLRVDYPGYNDHKMKHDEFRETVTELVNRYDNGETGAEFLDDFNKTVVRWIIEHIMKEDKLIGAHIRSLK